MSDDNPSNKQQSPTEDAGSEARTGAGTGFLPASTPMDVGSSADAPVAVVTSGIAADDDDPDVLEPTQIMPPIAARPGPGAYGQLGPAPGPHNPDQPWGPGSPAGEHTIPGPQYGAPGPQYGQPGGPQYGGPTDSGMPGEPYAGAPPYDPGAAGASGGPSKRRLLVTGGLVVALAVVGVGTFAGVRALTSGAHHSAPSAAQHAPSAAPSKPVPPDGGIDSDGTDGKAMTAAEAFPAKSVSAGGATFNQVRATVLDGCKDAAKGAFVKALRDGGCQRVVESTFVDEHKKYAVTAGIAALPTKDAATRTEKAADSKKDSWFAALPGKKSSGAEKIGKAGGYAASLVWGRYIVFSYATFSDGHTPGKKDTKLAELSDDFRTTATKAIAARASS